MHSIVDKHGINFVSNMLGREKKIDEEKSEDLSDVDFEIETKKTEEKIVHEFDTNLQCFLDVGNVLKNWSYRTIVTYHHLLEDLDMYRRRVLNRIYENKNNIIDYNDEDTKKEWSDFNTKKTEIKLFIEESRYDYSGYIKNSINNTICEIVMKETYWWSDRRHYIKSLDRNKIYNEIYSVDKMSEYAREYANYMCKKNNNTYYFEYYKDYTKLVTDYIEDETLNHTRVYHKFKIKDIILIDKIRELIEDKLGEDLENKKEFMMDEYHKFCDNTTLVISELDKINENTIYLHKQNAFTKNWHYILETIRITMVDVREKIEFNQIFNTITDDEENKLALYPIDVDYVSLSNNDIDSIPSCYFNKNNWFIYTICGSMVLLFIYGKS